VCHRLKGAVTCFVMAALRSRCGHSILTAFLLSSFFLFSSPIINGRRLYVYHISTHDVALCEFGMQAEMRCTRLAENTGVDTKLTQKNAVYALSHNFGELCLRK